MDNGKLNKYKANEFWLNNKEDFELVFKQKVGFFHCNKHAH